MYILLNIPKKKDRLIKILLNRIRFNLIYNISFIFFILNHFAEYLESATS